MTNHTEEATVELTGSAGDMQAVIDAARTGADPVPIDAGERFAAHRDVRVIGPDETYEQQPWRKRGSVTALAADSFAEYANRHAEPYAEVWADLERQKLVAVLNPHAESAGWGDHRVEYQVRPTVAWAKWSARDGSLVRQDVLAEHFEDRLTDFVTPDGAHMLELIQSFQATVGVNFESAKRLDNGERQLVYKETVDARAGRTGQFEIPAQFELALKPFEGADAYKVTCRFRYRITEGALAVGYQIVQPDELMSAAFADVVFAVEDSLNKSHVVYRGTAPDPQSPLR